MKIIIEHQNLSEMAIPRKQAIKRIESFSEEICSNIIKLSIYSDSQDRQHWIDELANWFNQINQITLKPNNKRFNYQEYKSMVFENYFGDSYSDVLPTLGSWQMNNCYKGKHYPLFDITKEVIRRTYSLFGEISDRFSYLFSIDNSMSRIDIINELKSIIY